MFAEMISGENLGGGSGVLHLELPWDHSNKSLSA